MINASGDTIISPSKYTVDYVYAIEDAAECYNGSMCRKCRGTTDNSLVADLPAIYAADGKWPNKIEKVNEYYITEGIKIYNDCVQFSVQ